MSTVPGYSTVSSPYNSQQTSSINSSSQTQTSTINITKNKLYDPELGESKPDTYVSFEFNSSRHSFVMKVYTILFLQLVTTFGTTLLFVLNQKIKHYVQNNMTLLIFSFILSFVFLIALACCGDIAKVYPYNYILLTLFTLVESYAVGVISSYYDTHIVMFATIITMGIIIGLTLFACQTKYDFTEYGPYLISLLLALILFGFLNLFLCLCNSCQAQNTFYSVCGALLFSFFIIYDTQRIIGGNHKTYQFSEDDYVFAALNLYLDVVNIFLQMLNLLQCQCGSDN